MKNNRLKATIYLNFNRISDFAEEVGEDPSLVSRVLSGQIPGAQRQEKYAKVLGVSLGNIFPREATHGRR